MNRSLFCKIVGFSLLIGLVVPLSVAFVILPGPANAAPKPKLEPKPAAPSVEEPFITSQQMDAKNAAITQCHAQTGIPLMGFGLTVVCVKQESTLWVR